MKNLHNETKKVYCATYETIKDSDRIFSDITNIVASNTKYSANQHSATNNRNPGDQDRDRDGGMIRKYYEMQLQKNLVDHEE